MSTALTAWIRQGKIRLEGSLIPEDTPGFECKSCGERFDEAEGALQTNVD